MCNVKNVSVGVKKNMASMKLEKSGGVVFIDTNITEELKCEGLVRDIIRQIQQFRKEKNLTPQEIVTLVVDTEDELKDIIKENKEEIKQTSLIKKIVFEPISGEGITINGERIVFALK